MAKKATHKKVDDPHIGFSQYIEKWLKFIRDSVVELQVHESYLEDAVQDVLIALAVEGKWKGTETKQQMFELIETVVQQRKDQLTPIEFDDQVVIIVCW